MTLVEFFETVQEQISAAAIHLENQRIEKCAFVLGSTYQLLEQWVEAYSDQEEEKDE